MNVKTRLLATMHGGIAAANRTAATWMVTNAVDGGPGSLRSAVNAAVAAGASGTPVLSWPESILGYTLQTQTNLTNPNPADRVTVPATIVQTNNLNEAVVPVSATGAQFYRLVLP